MIDQALREILSVIVPFIRKTKLEKPLLTFTKLHLLIYVEKPHIAGELFCWELGRVHCADPNVRGVPPPPLNDRQIAYWITKSRELLQDIRLSSTAGPKRDFVRWLYSIADAFRSSVCKMSGYAAFSRPRLMDEATILSLLKPEVLASKARNRYRGDSGNGRRSGFRTADGRNSVAPLGHRLNIRAQNSGQSRRFCVDASSLSSSFRRHISAYLSSISRRFSCS